MDLIWLGTRGGGVYAIRCKSNGKAYVGSTRRTFERRIRDHLKDLRLGRHTCRELQAIYDRCGTDDLQIEILYEVCDEAWRLGDINIIADMVFAEERRLLAHYRERGLLLNPKSRAGPLFGGGW